MKLASLMQEYTEGSQRYTKDSEIMIIARLYDDVHWINWWLAEYNFNTRMAHGFTKTPYWLQGWVTTDIYELEVLRVSWHPVIEIDEFFKPTKFKNLLFNKERTLN